MPDSASVEAVKAAVEAILPAADGRPGGADLDVHRHVVEALEQFVPGFTDLLATLLDSYAAAVRPEASFAELTPEERGSVFRAMSEEDAPDLRDLIDGLFAFTYGGIYSEWTGYDRKTGKLEPPTVWKDMGFDGRSRGHPDYREDV